MPEIDQSRKIKAKKRGNALGIWFFKVFLQLFGLNGAYRLLYIVCFHYLIFDREAVSGALAYVNKRFPGCGFLKGRRHVYRIFINQGRHFIDRYAFISKHTMFDIKLRGPDSLPALAGDAGQGLILLMTHIGNWQIAMTTVKELKKTVYMLMRPEDNPAIKGSLAISSEGGPVRVISPEQYLGGIIEIMNALRKGNIVSMMGDRGYGFNVIDVDFLGDKAWFPCSAFTIAAATSCPVVVLLSTKTGNRKYSVDVARVMHPSYRAGSEKRRQLRGWVQEYAGILESYVEKYPYQCFLFNDIWKSGAKTEA